MVWGSLILPQTADAVSLSTGNHIIFYHIQAGLLT